MAECLRSAWSRVTVLWAVSDARGSAAGLVWVSPSLLGCLRAVESQGALLTPQGCWGLRLLGIGAESPEQALGIAVQM